MLDRIWVKFFSTDRRLDGGQHRGVQRSKRCPRVEFLEGRQLLAASLGALNNVTAPSQMGVQVLLDGSGATGTSQQSFTATSSNPDIGVSVASGPYFSVSVTHTASSASDISFSGTLVMQLFNDLTPKTVSMIQQFVNSGYYVGKDFTRVMNGFPGPSDYIVQGGAPNPNGSGSSGQPGTPFANEIVQQLGFNNPQLVAMANAGGTNTNDTQFFLTTANPTSLDYRYTIFGMLVTGQTILQDMTQVSVENSASGELSFPVNPITITAASISSQNTSGVLHIDTTQAKPGETATITVTATDPVSQTQVAKTFTVTVGAYNGPTNPPINMRPFANDVSQSVVYGNPANIALSGQSGNPTASTTEALSYTLTTQPQHGTVSNFNASTGTFTYTPYSGYLGNDTIQYTVTSTNSAKSPVATSNPATVNLSITAGVTNSVRVVDRVLLVTPPPQKGRGHTNTISVFQTTGANARILTLVNGIIDADQPAVTSLDSIVVYGSKANDRITIDPSVTLPVTLDGGHGGRNRLIAGSSQARLHGWFGYNKLQGGSGRNQLVGQAGQVKFRPTRSTSMIFAGVVKTRKHDNRPNAPGGTFYRFVNGRMVAVSSTS